MNDIKITAILPAHNEEKGIPAAIKSIQKHVDTIIVACDNCSDDIYKVSKKMVLILFLIPKIILFVRLGQLIRL